VLVVFFVLIFFYFLYFWFLHFSFFHHHVLVEEMRLYQIVRGRVHLAFSGHSVASVRQLAGSDRCTSVPLMNTSITLAWIISRRDTKPTSAGCTDSASPLSLDSNRRPLTARTAGCFSLRLTYGHTHRQTVSIPSPPTHFHS